MGPRSGDSGEALQVESTPHPLPTTKMRAPEGRVQIMIIQTNKQGWRNNTIAMAHEANKYTMERPPLQPPTEIPDRSEGGHSQKEPKDERWGYIRGVESMAQLFKTKGSWEFAWQTLSCNNPVDPLCPLSVLAAEKVVAYIPAEEDKKLAPHHAKLINSMGIKQRTTEGKDATRPTIYQPQKKAMRDKQDTEGGRGASQHAIIISGLPITTIAEVSL